MKSAIAWLVLLFGLAALVTGIVLRYRAANPAPPPKVDPESGTEAAGGTEQPASEKPSKSKPADTPLVDGIERAVQGLFGGAVSIDIGNNDDE